MLQDRWPQDRILAGLERLSPRLRAALVLGLGLLVLLLTFDPRVSLGGDNALYQALARALVNQGEYRNLVAPGEPLETSVPWGYPALLALCMRLLGTDYARLAGVSVVLMLGALACVLAWLPLQLGRDWPRARALAFLVGVLVVMDEQLLRYGCEVLTEAPYMLASFAALWLFARHEEAIVQGRQPAAWAVLPPVALAAFGYLLRPVGVALVLALLGWLLLRRRFREGLWAGLVVLLVDGSWHLRAALIPSEEPNLYLRYFVKRSKFQTDEATAGPVDLLWRVVGNAWAYTREVLPEVLLGSTVPWLGLVGLLLAAGILLGFVVSARDRLRPAHLYLPLHLMALFLWLPEAVNHRYLVVVLPLLLVFLFQGAGWLGDRLLPPGARSIVPLLLFASIAWSLLARLDHVVPGLVRARAGVAAGDPMAGMGPGEREFHELCLWLGEHAAPDEIVASRKARLVWYFSDRKAVDLPPTEDPEALLRFFEEEEVDLVLVDSLRTKDKKTRLRLAALFEAHPERFSTLVRTRGGDFVARVVPAAAPMAPMGAAPTP